MGVVNEKQETMGDISFDLPSRPEDSFPEIDSDIGRICGKPAKNTRSCLRLPSASTSRWASLLFAIAFRLPDGFGTFPLQNVRSPGRTHKTPQEILLLRGAWFGGICINPQTRTAKEPQRV